MISIVVSVEEDWGKDLAIELGVKGYRVFRANSLLQIVEQLYKYKVDIVIIGQNIEGIYVHKLLPVLFRFYRDVKVIVYLNEYSPQLERTFRVAGVTYVVSTLNARERIPDLIDNLLTKKQSLHFKVPL